MRFVNFAFRCVLLSALSSAVTYAATPAPSRGVNLSMDGTNTPTVVAIADRAAFDAAYPQARRVDFADAPGKTAPFAIGSVRFSGGDAEVLDDLVGLPAGYWFGAQTTSPDFLLSNLTVQITFRWPVQAAGFDVQCLACDSPDQPILFTAVLLGDTGDVVGYEEVIPQALTGTPAGTPSFLGFDSDVPFKSIVLHREGNWMMANLRYLPAPGSRTGSN